MAHPVPSPERSVRNLFINFNKLYQDTQGALVAARPSAQIICGHADGVSMNNTVLDRPLGFESDEESPSAHSPPICWA